MHAASGTSESWVHQHPAFTSSGYRGTNPDGTNRWVEIARTAWPEGASASRQVPRNRITLAMLRTLNLPVLILMGDADLVTPPAQMRLMAPYLPNCETATVPE